MVFYIIKSRSYPEQYSNCSKYGEWENEAVFTDSAAADAYKADSMEKLGKWYEYAIDVITQE